MKPRRDFTLLLVSLLLIGAGRLAHAGFLDKFADQKGAMRNSGFTISYPEEKHEGGIRSLSVNASQGKVVAEAHSRHKQVMTGTLSEEQYGEFVGMLRQLDESAFSTKIPENCIEPINLRVHIGENTKVLVGCRGSNPNSTTISKLVRKLEFLLVQNTGISE